jgi:hypothetical protein
MSAAASRRCNCVHSPHCVSTDLGRVLSHRNRSDLLEVEFFTRGECGLQIGAGVEIIFRRLTRVHILRERSRLHRLRAESDGLVDRGLNLTVDDTREHAAEYDRHVRRHGDEIQCGTAQLRNLVRSAPAEGSEEARSASPDPELCQNSKNKIRARRIDNITVREGQAAKTADGEQITSHEEI